MKIYNTLTRTKEDLVLIEKGKVRMYVCGPTVYDSPHIGHARSAFVFDVVRRYLVHKGYDVFFVRNVTDIDDKIINRAAENISASGKSPEGDALLKDRFERHGPKLRFATELKNTSYYKSDLDKDTFCKYYPFLPHHFDILLQLLARLAKTRGGVGLRSAIKVIQDVLVDPGKTRAGAPLLADEKIGALATTVTFFDTLRTDIERPFPHIISGVKTR